jgi:hypothetical protein
MGFRMISWINLSRILPVTQLCAYGLSLFLFSGCLKAPNAEQNFGPEVDPLKIQSILKQGQSASAYSIEVGEFVYFEKIQQIESQEPEVIFQKGDTVVAKKEEPTHFVLVIISEIRELINGSFKPSHKELEALLPKPEYLEKLKKEQEEQDKQNKEKKEGQGENNDAEKRPEPPSENQEANQPKEAPEKVTFHNLRLQEILYPTPERVKKRPHCGGLNPEHCEKGIPSTQVSFDRVIWTQRGGDKSSFQFITSSYSPFLASQLSACSQSKIDFQGQRVKVTHCEVAQDFTWGTQNPK